MNQLRPLTEEDIAERIAKTHQYCDAQDVNKAIAAARLANTLLDEILKQITPGARESEIKQYALDVFAQHGIERTWHPPYVRFGAHTLLTFQDRADEDKVLAADDIAFVDIGIVANGVEGDAGRTVVFGVNPELRRLCDASASIFSKAHAYWCEQNPTGIALYEFIFAQAKQHQVLWNLDPAGHLIGAFPHRGWKRGINHFPRTIDAGKWILEIQIKHPTLPFGAFYEDLLYS